MTTREAILECIRFCEAMLTWTEDRDYWQAKHNYWKTQLEGYPK